MNKIYCQLMFLLLINGGISYVPKETGKVFTISQYSELRFSIELSTNNDLIGDWKLVLEAYDNNHNKTLDANERAKGISNHYFYRFSANGSCIISPFASNQLKSGFKGHYSITEKIGKKIITTYWDEAEQKGQREAQYTIISVNKDELVLLETTGDHTFWIFKRV